MVGLTSCLALKLCVPAHCSSSCGWLCVCVGVCICVCVEHKGEGMHTGLKKNVHLRFCESFPELGCPFKSSKTAEVLGLFSLLLRLCFQSFFEIKL